MVKPDVDPADSQAENEAELSAEEQGENEPEKTTIPATGTHQSAREILEASKRDFEEILSRATEAHQSAREILEASKRDFQSILSEIEEAHQPARETAEKAMVAVAEERARNEAEDQMKSEAGEAVEEELEPTTEVEAGVAPGAKGSARLYQGKLELEIAAIDAKQVSNLLTHLRKVSGLQVISLRSSATGDSTISVVIKKPIPLTSILEEMPAVKEVCKNGENIAVTLRGRGRRLWEY